MRVLQSHLVGPRLLERLLVDDLVHELEALDGLLLGDANVLATEETRQSEQARRYKNSSPTPAGCREGSLQTSWSIASALKELGLSHQRQPRQASYNHASWLTLRFNPSC